MQRTLKFRIYPKPSQTIELDRVLRLCRNLYNAGLEQRITAYRSVAKKSLTLREQRLELIALKKAFPEFGTVHTHIVQDALIRLDKSFRGFFARLKVIKALRTAGIKTKKKPGFPRFKARRRYNSFTLYNTGHAVEAKRNRLRLSKIGLIRMFVHRPLEGKIKTLTIKRDVDRWFAVFSVELPDPPAPRGMPANPIGLDAGLTDLVTLSDGTKIGNPRHLNHAEEKIKFLQRRLSRKEKGSANRAKARYRLARIHRKARNVRADFHHKLSKLLVARYDGIFVENLQIPNMMQNHCLARSIGDAGWSGLFAKLEYKAANAGIQFGRPSAHGTSIECSSCAAGVPKPLSERTHRCGNCGLVMDRDENAAKNVLRRGLDALAGVHTVRSDRPELTPVEILASTPPKGARANVGEAGSPCL